MNNSLKMFYPQHSITLRYLEAVKLLKTAPFGVFLSFIDPRTDTLVQKVFPFFYDPLHTYSLKGRCFISEWGGLQLYIPSDLNWYIKTQRELKLGLRKFRQCVNFLSCGRFVTKDIDEEVGVDN
ncbi:hypothetical protein [Xenorhabdus sp. KJ12.1]|uniref:hypothetical protein n=1 Tax=Xenorhabdus sp. KJ12.1 TaxID=1851571 RepID=UPI000C0649BB|nr:hypothetical protein [Xenorhabdus sp. KJ12.1]PHM72263.1 hypothetical protein Xekj_00541 [Xenorhabdus sp. KJ12.1]